MTSSVISETGCKDTDFFHLSKLFYVFFHFFVFALKNSPDIAAIVLRHEDINGRMRIIFLSIIFLSPLQSILGK